MNKQSMTLWAAIAILAFCSALSADDAQWVRVTVLLEPGTSDSFQPRDTLIPGGVYSLAEVDERGQADVDEEILKRVRHLGESIRSAEESMRLSTLLARQYYLKLEVGRRAVLPAVDLNPRLSVVFLPVRFVGGMAVCKVQFLEPEGMLGTPDFTGEPITLMLHDADLRVVLRTFSVMVPVEIVVDPSVTGTVTVDLREIPWDQALDAILRINGLGWTRNNGTIRIEPLGELSSRKRVRTEATLNLPRPRGSSMIASRGDDYNPTMVLVVESVDGPPGLAAERDGLVYPRWVQTVPPSSEDLRDSFGYLAVFRARVTTDGKVKDAEVLASPSPAYAERLLEALGEWRFRSVLDEAGRKQEAVVGYGVRFRPPMGTVPQRDIAHIGVEIEVGPPPPGMVGNELGGHMVSAYVRDLDSGEVISAPRILVQKAQEGVLSTTVPRGDREPSKFEMKILVTEDGKTVNYSWNMITDGVVVASHCAEIKL